MKDIKQLVGIESTAVADLIQGHQDILETNDKLVEDINIARKSMEFFMALDEAPRALYEATLIKSEILRFLGLID
jgi:hypothetical protein|tara:strand:- start:668 stop:892 length:225 start_codon:yes stop_codon:yes gene_type:complete